MKVVKQELSPQLQYAYDEAKKFVLNKVKAYDVLSLFEFDKVEEVLNNIYFEPANQLNKAQFRKSPRAEDYAFTIALSRDFTQEMLNHEMMHAGTASLVKHISFLKKNTLNNGKDKFRGLTEGLTNYFAGSNEGENAYVFPEVVAKLLCDQIGEKEMFKFFIKGDLNGLTEKIKEVYKLNDTKLAYEFLESLDVFVDQKKAHNKTSILNRTRCMIGAVCNSAEIYSKMLANKMFKEGETNPREVYYQMINDLSFDYSVNEYFKSAKDEKGNAVEIEGDLFDQIQLFKEDMKEEFLLKNVIEKTLNTFANSSTESANSAVPVETKSLKK